jgi:ribosomal protein L37E
MAKLQEEVKYFYVVHGTIPELMPRILYRRSGRKEQYRRKILKCPFCGFRITDVDEQTKVELYKHPVKLKIPCQFYIQCRRCNAEVGINIV